VAQLYGWPKIISLQCIAPAAGAAWNFNKLGAGPAPMRAQAVSVTGHLFIKV